MNFKRLRLLRAVSNACIYASWCLIREILSLDDKQMLKFVLLSLLWATWYVKEVTSVRVGLSQQQFEWNFGVKLRVCRRWENRWNLRAPCDRAVYEGYVVFCKIFSMLIAHKQSLSGNDKWNAILLLQVWMATVITMANRVTEVQTFATMIRICCQNCLLHR